jgi:hypothetical protein
MTNLKMGLGLIALLVCVSWLLMGAAQDTTETSPKTRTVTGCLQNDDHANEYRLIAEKRSGISRARTLDWRIMSTKGHS